MAAVRTLGYWCVLWGSLWMAGVRAEEFSLQNKGARQEKGSWVLTFVFKNDSPRVLQLDPHSMSVNVHGYVSNSLLPGHGVPRLAEASLDSSNEEMSRQTLYKPLPNPDPNDPNGDGDEPTCNEVAILSVASGASEVEKMVSLPLDSLAAEPVTKMDTDAHKSARARHVQMFQKPLYVNSGEVFLVRIDLVHQHGKYSDYDALMGEREVDFYFGGTPVHETLRLKSRPQSPKGWVMQSEEGTRDPNPPKMTNPEATYLFHDGQTARLARYDVFPVRPASTIQINYQVLVASQWTGTMEVMVEQRRSESAAAPKETVKKTKRKYTIQQGQWIQERFAITLHPDTRYLKIGFEVSPDDRLAGVWINQAEAYPIDSAGNRDENLNP